MIQIRHATFETNSSSSHSISLQAGEELLDTIRVTRGGKVYLDGGEFGWGYELHRDALTKANYCAVYALEVGNDRFMEMLKSVVKKQTMCKEVVVRATKTDSDSKYYSYIDHQSVEPSCIYYNSKTQQYVGDPAKDQNVGAVVFRSEENLRDFIFNQRAVLVISNDNH